MKIKAKIITLILTVLTALPCTASEKRVALVIGNEAYKNSPLNNPVKDATAMAEKLETLGFDVISKNNLETDDMDATLREFYKKANKSELALFYFSGHGIESNGISYILPVNNEISNEDDLERTAVNLSKVLNKICGTECGKYIIILDACRNNPLKKMRGASRGLQTVSATNAAEGIIFYACAAGSTADDGNGDHSPFTKALLNHIGDENKTFDDVTTSVIGDVKLETKNSQIPYKYGSISSAIYLNGNSGVNRQYDDNIVSGGSKSAALPIILFIILFITMITCFIIFTAKGKEVLVLVKDKTISLKNTSVDFARKSTSSLKEKVLATASGVKSKVEEKSDKIKKAKEESAAAQEEHNKAEDERQKFMKATLIGNKFYCAEDLVSVAQYNKITGASIPETDAELPLTNVSYFEAASFMNLLSEKSNLDAVYDLSDPNNVKADNTRNGWRLPSEAEWKQAYGNKNINGMTGLVWQWCNDMKKDKQVLKGGAWDCSDKYINSSSRMMVVKEFKSDAVGIRGVRNK